MKLPSVTASLLGSKIKACHSCTKILHSGKFVFSHFKIPDRENIERLEIRAYKMAEDKDNFQ